MVHYSSDTSYTRIEYPSADPYSTYTMYNPADVRWDVLNDIMSSYNLHNYQILGLNGVCILRGVRRLQQGPDPMGQYEDRLFMVLLLSFTERR